MRLITLALVLMLASCASKTDSRPSMTTPAQAPIGQVIQCIEDPNQPACADK